MFISEASHLVTRPRREEIAEKAAIWAYLFLVVGVVQKIIEYRREKKDARVEKLSKVGDTVGCED